jgi:hypothetical protein
MDRDESCKLECSALVVLLEKEKIAMMYHCKMGHVAFDKMTKVFPDVMSEVDKNNLKCEACEYAEHTRNAYVSKGLRSISPFMLVHSDVWTCPISSINGIHPGLASAETEGKVCRLKKSVYGLKQSPRAWFDRFRRVVCEMGYGV